VLLRDMGFSELDGASVDEQKQAIDLACSRSPWWRDIVYLKSVYIYYVLFFITCAVITFYVDHSWISIPMILILGYLETNFFHPKRRNRIKPNLKQALYDVRQHKYR
jgi:hypothetical protein